MKFNEELQKNKKKKRTKIKVGSIFDKSLYYLIGIPFLKIEKTTINIRNKYWLKNEEKYKKIVFREMINYIVKDMASYNCEEYYIYNTIKYDEISGFDAIFIPEFLGYGVSKKYTKRTRIFYSVFIKNGHDKNKYALYFYNLLEDHFKTFNDIEVERGKHDHWRGSHEYIKLKLKLI